MKSRRIFILLFVPAAWLALSCASCRRSVEKNEIAPISKHEHRAPHGGTAVELGAEAYHLELVREAATGTVQAFVLDGELENFVRIPAPILEMDVIVAGAPRLLVLHAVANSATGETIGDTALFEVQAEWLKTASSFDGTLRSIAIRGTIFNDVKFSFPLGNERK